MKNTTTISPKKTAWQKFRKLINDLHLWFGLIGGIFIFLICLTGTIYTFQDEIKRLLEPKLYEVSYTGQELALTPEALIDAAQKHTGRKAVSITLPETKTDAVTIGIENASGKGRPESLQLNPYTAEVLGLKEKGRGSAFMMGVFRMHRWLLLDTETGRPIVGIATVLFCFASLTGLVIWFPKKLKNWKQGLGIKTRASWKRVNHDLHNALGFYSFIFLLVMGLTGLCWSFEGYKNGVSKLLGAPVFGQQKEGGKEPGKPKEGALSGKSAGEQNQEEAGESQPMAALSTLIATANNTLNYKGMIRLNLPKKAGAPVEIAKIKTGFFSGAVSDKLKLDAASGKVLKTERFADKPFNEKIAASIRPIHTGEIFGTFSKILYFISCLIATSLPVTGTIIWLNKLRKKQKRRTKIALPVALPEAAV